MPMPTRVPSRMMHARRAAREARPLLRLKRAYADARYNVMRFDSQSDVSRDDDSIDISPCFYDGISEPASA